MTISSSLLVPEVASSFQIKVEGNHSRPIVKVLLDENQYVLVWDFSSSVGIHENRQGIWDANCIRNLNNTAASKPGCNNAFCCLPYNVCTTTVNLGWIFSRESTTTMSTPTTIDEDGVHPNRYHGPVLVLVLNSHLGLTIGPQPWDRLILSDLRKLGTNLGSKDMGEWHELRCLISGITKHVALVASSNFLGLLGKVSMNSLCNFWALFLNVDEDFAVVSIKAYIS
ncbi:hypothetical protein DVH24_001453 [Malus domestica]|uniref:Uncharacterized protein n=1 Tax=Malus domestica TaxID=3750 RepID=A0A498JZ88_MALDO|nr:hypothetical protein DVH24_001453 [Malus domestica]